MSNPFQKASRKKAKLRLAIDGPAGAGKSYTALRFAWELATHEAKKTGTAPKIAAIDTEHGSLSLYEGIKEGKDTITFDVIEPDNFAPAVYASLIEAAAEQNYHVVIIDSLSHAWAGVGGALEMVDRSAKQSRSGNSFTAWRDVTPQHNRLVETILSVPIHVIATMRTKIEHVLEEQTTSSGKTVLAPKKIGTKPIQREGMEYEFTVVADMDVNHTLTVSKTRCPAIDGEVVSKPGPGFISKVIRWLETGEESKTKFQRLGANDAQIAKITEIAAQVYADLEDLSKEVTRRYSVRTLQELAAKDANDLIIRLEAKLKLLEAQISESAKQEDPEPIKQEAADSKADPTVKNNDFADLASDDQIKLLKPLRAEFFTAAEILDVGDQNNAWKKFLAKRGVDSATKLSRSQADELIETLKKKIRDRWTEDGHPELIPECARETAEAA